MNEQRYASRIRQVLNHGLNDIPPAAARRLEAARHLALSRQKQEAPQLVLASTDNRLPWPMLLRSGVDFARVKPLLAIAALLAGMWLSFYWHSIQYVNEIEAVDSALLADDLPPEAFLDHEFIEWLKDDSSPH
ncbi:DUF3619 family protein [Azonexus sp.]|jgi:hypothetical protein|uniref:DUF3619 family protein n=1 Tax=Azonexus sp. TaxID=1872668 RepID=UPI00282FF9FD|nr:DUF3619 family protein [Azonexus sp.]MDR1995693.1 DUF3619 family protein [Azonexus sp.]